MKIRIEQVAKQFDTTDVLKGIDLTIAQGEFIALLGPSGCGKTTLLNAIAGFLDITSGRIAVDDDVWSTAMSTRAPELRNVGMVFQDFALWPHLSVVENVAFGLKVKRMDKNSIRRRVHEVLSLVQMTAYTNAFPHQLSGGQKQRIAIARALAPNPTVLLMDEPLSSLDAKLREHMRWDLLSIIRDADITTIYVTHDQTEALSMADRVVLLNCGRIEQIGTPQELYDCPRTAFAAYFMGASNLLKVDRVAIDGGEPVVHWNGIQIQIERPAVHPEHPVLFIRPSDIDLSIDNSSIENGTSIRGKIARRAYQGATWMYQVRPTDTNRAEDLFEVWSKQSMDVGMDVYIHIPRRKAMLVEGENSALATSVRS